MKKSFLIIILIIFIVFFVVGCGNKQSSEKKELDSFSFDISDYGILSKVNYDKKVYGNFSINTEGEPMLYFEDNKSNIGFSLNYTTISVKNADKEEKELSKLERYKSFESGNYKGYIYSSDGNINFVNIVLKLGKDEDNYYLAYIVASAIESNENDYVFDSISNSDSFLELVKNLEFSFDTEKYNKYIESLNDANK